MANEDLMCPHCAHHDVATEMNRTGLGDYCPLCGYHRAGKFSGTGADEKRTTPMRFVDICHHCAHSEANPC